MSGRSELARFDVQVNAWAKYRRATGGTVGPGELKYLSRLWVKARDRVKCAARAHSAFELGAWQRRVDAAEARALDWKLALDPGAQRELF